MVEKLLGRRKLKSSYEYEVKWVNCAEDKNIFMPRDELIDMVRARCGAGRWGCEGGGKGSAGAGTG